MFGDTEAEFVQQLVFLGGFLGGNYPFVLRNFDLESQKQATVVFKAGQRCIDTAPPLRYNGSCIY